MSKSVIITDAFFLLSHRSMLNVVQVSLEFKSVFCINISVTACDLLSVSVNTLREERSSPESVHLYKQDYSEVLMLMRNVWSKL